jgi:hypothetical protein
MLLTDIKLFFAAALSFISASSSPYNESAENRLEGVDGICGSSIGGPSETPIGEESQYVDDCREPVIGSGVDGCLPKGSGDKGMTGESSSVFFVSWTKAGY